jgi:hypothetical protein
VGLRFWVYYICTVNFFDERENVSLLCSIALEHPEPVFLNMYGAPESIPRNEFRQPM